MVQLTQRQIPRIAPFFTQMHDTMIQTCLQGNMGSAWADDAHHPACAMLLVANFCFLAGEVHSPNAPLLVGSLPPKGYTADDLYVVAQDDAWTALLLANHPTAARVSRYAIKHDGDVFDRQMLRAITGALPSDFCLKRFDEHLYHEALRSDWSCDMCAHFENAADYLKRGRGFGILYGGRLISGASSYTVYNGGIEIEIDTHKDFRRRGLALVCGAALILDCLEHGIYPSWDAANLASVRLSEKLGYHFDKEYKAYCLPVGPAIRDDTEPYRPGEPAVLLSTE
ncbi:MAG: GNAT family N-acetyltransferase [Acetanaerobacterium sp.]